jgi:hypothetical protein
VRPQIGGTRAPMYGSKAFTPGCAGTLTLALTLETAPGETADGADHRQPPLALTVDLAAGRYPFALQVAAAAQHAVQASIRAEGALEALDTPRGVNRRPVQGKGRRDDAITVWGADAHRPAFAPLEPQRPGAQSDRPATLEATIASRAGESAPARQAQHA